VHEGFIFCRYNSFCERGVGRSFSPCGVPARLLSTNILSTSLLSARVLSTGSRLSHIPSVSDLPDRSRLPGTQRHKLYGLNPVLRLSRISLHDCKLRNLWQRLHLVHSALSICNLYGLRSVRSLGEFHTKLLLKYLTGCSKRSQPFLTACYGQPRAFSLWMAESRFHSGCSPTTFSRVLFDSW